jgi:predicted sulfurtransferase
VAAALLSAGSVFAGDKAGCCMKHAANEQKMTSCANMTTADLNLTADQKSKIEKWQAECCKAGCTKESHAKFLKQAKGILSVDQYAKLKAECDKSSKKSEA